MSIKILSLSVFADAAMMIPDFSSADVDLKKKRSAILEQLAEAKGGLQELQSDETQSRLQDALQQRSDQHDAAALDSSKSDASDSTVITETSHQTADASLRNSTATTDRPVSTSEVSDASQQKPQESAGEQSHKPEKLLQFAALWAGQNVMKGQLPACLDILGSVSSQ